jgi:hypothetical protein
VNCVKSLDCRSHLPAKRGRKLEMTLLIMKKIPCEIFLIVYGLFKDLPVIISI